MSAPGAERGLFDELRARLAAALEGMAGESPSVAWDPLPSAPAGAALKWRQPMSALDGAVWLLASEEDFSRAGFAVLKAAGIHNAEPAESRSTFLEVTNQALGGLGTFLTARMGRDVSPTGGAEATGDPGPARWAEFNVRLREASFTFAAGIEEEFLESIERGGAAVVADAAVSEPRPNGPIAEHAAVGSKTFDLLLEVELPVSVSFGRAQIPLKDVLKLTTGSIVELNRSIVEPVEIIVNNCVIARGEVVVVEGNFGVRIQEVISRQDRLRTLQ